MKKRLIFSLLGGILVLLVLGSTQPYIRPHMLANAVEFLLAWPIYLGYRIFGAEHQKLMILATVVENVTVSSAILYSLLKWRGYSEERQNSAGIPDKLRFVESKR